MSDDLKERLEKSEAALDWILDRLKANLGRKPVRDMDEAILFAEEALKPFYIERITSERDAEVERVTGDHINAPPPGLLKRLVAVMDEIGTALEEGVRITDGMVEDIEDAANKLSDGIEAEEKEEK